MCRARGRRCPSSKAAGRATESARKAKYRAGKALVVARAKGDPAEVARAERDLAGATERLAGARADQATHEQKHQYTSGTGQGTEEHQDDGANGATSVTNHGTTNLNGKYDIDNNGAVRRLDGRPATPADAEEARNLLISSARSLEKGADGMRAGADRMTGPAAAGAPGMRAGADQMSRDAQRSRDLANQLHLDSSSASADEGRDGSILDAAGVQLDDPTPGVHVTGGNTGAITVTNNVATGGSHVGIQAGSVTTGGDAGRAARQAAREQRARDRAQRARDRAARGHSGDGTTVSGGSTRITGMSGPSHVNGQVYGRAGQTMDLVDGVVTDADTGERVEPSGPAPNGNGVYTTRSNGIWQSN